MTDSEKLKIDTKQIAAYLKEDFARRENALVTAVFNQKGGVTKSTVASTLSWMLAKAEFKTLLIDLDPQGDASDSFGIELEETARTLYDVFMEPRAYSVESLVKPVAKNLDIIPTDLRLSKAEIGLVGSSLREYKLKNALATIRKKYDFIVIDCPPSLGQLSTNALSASDGVLVPVTTDYRAMKGLGLALETIEDIQYELNPSLEVIGILFTRYVINHVQSNEVIQTIKRTIDNEYYIFNAKIRETVKAKESPAASKVVVEYAPNHPITEDFKEFTLEFLNACLEQVS